MDPILLIERMEQCLKLNSQINKNLEDTLLIPLLKLSINSRTSLNYSV
jgi:hypothetical protein